MREKKNEFDSLLVRDLGSSSFSDLRRERPVWNDEVGRTCSSNQLGG